MIKIKKSEGANSYYVYLHKRISDKAITYVGKGSTTRAFNQDGRSKSWFNGVEDEYFIDIVESGLTEEQALKLEDDLIRYIGREDLGRGTLLNNDGGVDESEVVDKKLYEVILEAIEKFKNNAEPFTYNKLSNYVDRPYSVVMDVISKNNLKGVIAQANEEIDKWLINDAFDSIFGDPTNEQISEHTGVAICDRFVKRINEVRDARSKTNS